MAKVYLALGSNVGDRRAYLKEAIQLLEDKVHIVEVSKAYETKPWGYEQQDNFINMVISGKTELTPEQLLSFVKNVETKVGRIPRFKLGPREMDIDIIFYDNLVYKEGQLQIPHPGFCERDFVLMPLMDLDPNLVDPVSKKTVRQLYSKLPKNKLSILNISAE